jgi:predicted glycogen debranching enzyme
MDRPRSPLIRSIPCRQTGPGALLDDEWLVTNGLGGYSSGTLLGVPTRRYHGLLVASLPAPMGRTLMVGELLETILAADGAKHTLGRLVHPEDRGDELDCGRLREFRLELGLPVWIYDLDGIVLEKRVLMPHKMNTVLVVYRLLAGNEPLALELTLLTPFRPHGAPVGGGPTDPVGVRTVDDRWEIIGPAPLPALKLSISGSITALRLQAQRFQAVFYREEEGRGYDCVGDLHSPASFVVQVSPDRPVVVLASTEEWSALTALQPDQALDAEAERRRRLLTACGPAAHDDVAAELVLAADQFLMTPAGRAEEAARIRAEGDEPRSVIAGYYWFTDWGRDTMISLEGLTLATGRFQEAGCILRTFAHHIRDGLIPNFFPDGDNEGVYHTADATLWFFHALHRYVETTGDRATLRILLPKLTEVVAAHLHGTRFGIGVDPRDGLLIQGQAGYQLTWMDAKVGDWVVTPRRGKAVEINALWYNALCLLRAWLHADPGPQAPANLDELLDRARSSFNARFWNPTTGCLFDVLDGEAGNDSACRPNQLFALSLDYPVLEESRWRAVLRAVHDRLLTPVGLRTLAPDHADYKRIYRGDLRSRDAAYHQGAVWPWLIGPFVDAWLRVFPDDKRGARRCLEGLLPHLGEGGIGTISEIFDAEPPHIPRGCIAQAWSVAELLRCWLKTS